MSDQIFWYLTRSAALVAWLAAAGSVLIGITTSSRLLGRRPTVPWLVDLHRMLSALASLFVLVHMATLWFDEFVRFRWADLLVPGTATVPGLSSLSLALGVIAAWLLAAVQVSSLLRGRIPELLWRWIHYFSYATMALSTVHAYLAGSDVGNPVVAAVGVSVITALVLATVVRVSRALRHSATVDREPSITPTPVETRPPAAHWPGPPPGYG